MNLEASFPPDMRRLIHTFSGRGNGGEIEATVVTRE